MVVTASATLQDSAEVKEILVWVKCENQHKWQVRSPLVVTPQNHNCPFCATQK